ncbi:uncharacterized protein LOC120146655 [Hibiscus syriacus]|uniref:uncharacterized protein LOC120146655 n=1 Tax=Hibiscus syriacus TaxID=106335 RepID=UPI001923C250|nr:uncharacterized protein LOC120146655 [Hibiscus syriacus]
MALCHRDAIATNGDTAGGKVWDICIFVFRQSQYITSIFISIAYSCRKQSSGALSGITAQNESKSGLDSKNGSHMCLKRFIFSETILDHACQTTIWMNDRHLLFLFSVLIGVKDLKALMKVVASQPPVSVHIKWHTGWFLRKLLQCEGNMLTDDNVHLFNTSYEQSRECLRKELDGCRFDHIPNTIGHEWGSSKKVSITVIQFLIVLLK